MASSVTVVVLKYEDRRFVSPVACAVVSVVVGVIINAVEMGASVGNVSTVTTALNDIFFAVVESAVAETVGIVVVVGIAIDVI